MSHHIEHAARRRASRLNNSGFLPRDIWDILRRHPQRALDALAECERMAKAETRRIAKGAS